MFPLIVPEDAVTFPFELKVTLYVVPLQIGLLTVSIGETCSLTVTVAVAGVVQGLVAATV